VIRRRKYKEEEEEEEEIVEETGLGEQKGPTPPGPEQPLAAPPVLHEVPPASPVEIDQGDAQADHLGPGMGASGAAVAEDSDEEEEGRKRRGGGLVPGEDEETGLKVPTAPRLPPPEPPQEPELKLRPIPTEQEEDDEWDHAGRNIDVP